MARSKKSKSRQEAETSAPAEAAAEEAQDPVEPEPETPPQETASVPAPRRKKKGSGVSVQVTARGDADEVSAALSKMGPQRGAPQEPDPEEPEEEGMSDEEVMRLLSNPRNKVTVVRTFPKRWRGARCNVQLDQEGYRCPVNFDEIKTDVFRRFGGKSFMAYVHPNTMMGMNKILAAIPFENAETDEPLFELPQDENEVVDPRLLPIPADGSDPTMVGEEDPYARMERNLKTQTRLKARQLELATLGKQLEEFEGTKKEIVAEASNPGRSVEDRIAFMQLENKMDRQIEAIRNAIDKVASEPPAAPAPAPTPQPPQRSGDDNLVKILMAQNQAAENRFNVLMQQQTQLLLARNQGGGQKEDLDSMLDKVAKFKAAFGEGDGRVKRLQDTLMEIAMDRMLGESNGGGDTSDVRYAVDKALPLVKTFIDKKLTGPDEAVPTREQYLEAVKLEATKITQNLIKQGYLVKGDVKGIAGPTAHHKAGAPAEKKPAPAPPAGEKNPEPPKEEEDRVAGPPKPSTPEYSRKLAVDFVLDSIISDIKKGFPDDRFVIGDALDHLDEEILDQLLTVGSGEDLEKVVGPHCTPEKIQAIKDYGKNPRVKTWLTRVITTIQDEYRREIEAAPKEETK
jgi:hypothetical protein